MSDSPDAVADSPIAVADAVPRLYDWANGILGMINVVVLYITCINISNRHEFFPSTEKWDWWIPWASCYWDDCPYDECCSQFLLDEYSFTHFSHGYVLYFWAVAVPVASLLRCYGLGVKATSFDWLGFNLAFLIETLWEAFENTENVINAFRASGAPDYAGDTGLNVVGDLLVCMLGYVLVNLLWMYTFERWTWKAALVGTVVYSILMGVILYAWICDGLIFIWINLLGLATIPTCGPNLPLIFCILAIVVILCAALAPVCLKQCRPKDADANAYAIAPTRY